jgi:class 3 adenylate cyclase
MKPIVGTPSCQNRHLGVCLSGTLHIVCDDGTELDIRAGDAYEVPPGHDAWVVGDEAVSSIEFAAARTYGVVEEDENARIVATVLFTDIVDSTRMLERLGDATWKNLLLEHNVRVRELIDRFRGREIETTGDGFLVLFDGPARAVRCAAAMAPALRDLGIAVRAGLHTGEIELLYGKARGVAVHAAARVTSLAGPGEVLVSGTTNDLLAGAKFRFVDRGEHELKGLTGLRKVYALASDEPGS